MYSELTLLPALQDGNMSSLVPDEPFYAFATSGKSIVHATVVLPSNHTLEAFAIILLTKYNFQFRRSHNSVLLSVIYSFRLFINRLMKITAVLMLFI